MSDDGFNPYHEWLGLDRSVTQPNHYQLLGLDPAEQSAQRVAAAANRATARVRSCRPGPRSAQWAKLLEEITAAASCLSDPARRAEYDRQSGRGGAARSYNRPAPRSRVIPTAGGSSAPNALPVQGPAFAAIPMQAPQGVPPNYSPSAAGPAAYLDPMAPVVPAGPATAPGYGQTTGYGAATLPPNSPMSMYPVAQGYPISGKDRIAPAKVRQRSDDSRLTMFAICAGGGMVLLAGLIFLIIVSQNRDIQDRNTHVPAAQKRPSSVPRSPPSTFHRQTPPPRRVRPLGQTPRFPMSSSGTDKARSRFPVAGSQTGNGTSDDETSMAIDPLLPLVPENPLPDTTPPAVDESPADSTPNSPAFPAGPTLPAPDRTPPDQPNRTDPSESPAAPVPPKEAISDGATPEPRG